MRSVLKVRIRPLFALAVVALLAAACGGDAAGPGGDDGGEGPMSARIDGRAWSSHPTTGGNLATLILPGAYVIMANRVTGLQATTVTLSLSNVRGPGTYKLGMGPTTPGGTGQLVESPAGWSTPLSGDAGSVTISTITPTRIAGTFQFTAEPITGGATGNRQVTNGRFDLPLNSGNVGPLADNAGHLISANVGGTPWTASTVATNWVLANNFIASTSNTAYTVSFSITGYTGVGAYPLSWNVAPLRAITVARLAGHPQGAACCWGGPGSTGTVTVTSVTAARVVGTFNGTLTPQPSTAATGSITITGGTFDLGR